MIASNEPKTIPVVQNSGHIQSKYVLGDELVGRNPWGERGPTPRCVNAGNEPIMRSCYRPLHVEDPRAPWQIPNYTRD